MCGKSVISLMLLVMLLIFASGVVSLASEAEDKIGEYREAIEDVGENFELVLSIEVSVNGSIGELANLLSGHGYALPTVSATPGTPEYTRQAQARNDAVLEIIDDPQTKEELEGELSSNELNILEAIMQALTGDKESLLTAEGGLASLEKLLNNAVSDLPVFIQQILTGDLKGLGLGDVQELFEDATESMDSVIKLPGKIVKIIGIIEKVLSFIFFFI